MAKSVINGQIQHLSVSAIQAFNPKDFGGCNRRWWLKYVAGLPEEAQLSQIVGTKIHKDIETHLLKGTPVTNEVVKAGLHFLPTPGTVEVEKPFNGILTAAGIPMKGFLDVYNKGPIYIDSLGHVQLMGSGELEVLDWKSTSDLKYAKAGNELKTTQMVGYAKFASLLEPQLERVRLSHVYFKTKGRPEAVKNSVIISLDEIQNRYQSVEDVAQQIKQVALLERVEDVAPNRAACTAFRGCPFINSCPQDSIGGQMSKSMIDMLREAKAKAQGQTPAAPTKPAPVVQEMESIEADYNQAGRVFGPCPQCAQPVSSANGSQTPSGRIVHTDCKGVAVLPPDAPKPQSLPVEAPKPAAPQVAPVEAPKERKTRGPNKPKPMQVTPAPEPTAEDHYAGGYEAGFDAALDHSSKNKGLTLFVDVRLSGLHKMETQPLEPIIIQAMERLADEAKVPDLRVAVDGPLAFGKWKAYLSLELVGMVKTGELRGVYTLNDVKESEVKAVVLDAIGPHFDLVVRGG